MNMYGPIEIIITPETTYLLTSHNNDTSEPWRRRPPT
jgi:hypothetical protein